MSSTSELGFGEHAWFGEQDGDRPSERSDGASSTRTNLAQPLVLVVDDYADTRLLYVENLREAGFRVIEAENGNEAFIKAVDFLPDAVVMDLSMPHVDGWEATRLMRGHPQLRSVYILALSALEGDQSRSMAFDAGCDDFAAKPLLPASLAEILRTRLER